MADRIDLSGRVALVTGAGNGLGREYALELARRGASIVVNDLGTSLDGEGRSSDAAARVVAEIEAAGGKAVANAGSVTSMADAEAMVADAVGAFGRLDIVISNTGILRDASFKKMAIENFETVIDVHLLGAARIIKAAWNVMNDAGYGRIVVATSGAGLYGNFGQANYGAAKMAVNGLINVLRHEGAKYNIRCNAISPSAWTRMTENLLPPDVGQWMKPELVSPMVAWLCSEECDQNGEIMAATAGGYARVQYFVTDGAQFDPAEPVTIEMIQESIDKIRDLNTVVPYFGMFGTVEKKLRAMGRIK